MVARSLPSQEYLKQCFDYNEGTGLLAWKTRPAAHFKSESQSRAFNKQFAGKPALNALSCTGYRHGALDMKVTKAHRIIWKLKTGKDAEQVDHINGDKTDNSWENLRDVGYFENTRNVAKSSSNTSGAVGVGWMESKNCWRASIKSFGKSIHIGTFKRFEDALAARKKAERSLGFHPNHGRAAL
jgi:hypothetical protein